MALTQIDVAGYRSVRDLSLTLSPINVLTGPNGSGKSNLYNSLLLIARAADAFASVFWAGGERIRYTRKKPVKRVVLAFESDEDGIPDPDGFAASGTVDVRPRSGGEGGIDLAGGIETPAADARPERAVGMAAERRRTAGRVPLRAPEVRSGAAADRCANAGAEP